MVNISPKTPIDLIKISRPVHWIKNLSIFAALIFSGELLTRNLVIQVFIGFLVFNLAASATYAFNDILDAKSDRLHPIKKNRPIARGSLSPVLALFFSASCAFVALAGAYFLSYLFFLLLVSYLLLQIAYSLYLKNIHIIDILIIASGFIIRVYSGAFIINAHLSVWFLLCVISIALFLASGKRRAELSIVGKAGFTRKSLSRYSPELLNSYVTMFGNAAWMSWALFTFFESPKASVPLWLFLAELSRATTINKLLMITIPITIFGIMRYQALIFEGKAETPEKLLLTDRSLVGAVSLWITIVIWVLYGGVAVHSA
jgi:decaprenyl-phosphate phosphoribosyltransferase